MKPILLVTIVLSGAAVILITGGLQTFSRTNTHDAPLQPPVIDIAPKKSYRQISGQIKKGETLYDIFKRNDLDVNDLFLVREASAKIHRLRNLSVHQAYSIKVDDQNQVHAFKYAVNDTYWLSVLRTDIGFVAQKEEIPYEKRVTQIGGIIQDNLISSMGEGKDKLLLALNLSDIFAWEFDFTSDLRNGDTFKLIVEELYLENEFKKYGNILAAEFVSDGNVCQAYRFEHDGISDYYDAEGNPLRRAFLKAPLSFRRISSGFSRSRYHPILKEYKPHHGVDYAAARGTPVSVAGDGTIEFSGYEGGYGNLIIIRHLNGYKTYYGHLSGFSRNMTKGVKVKQGQVIGYVGSTGLATGPHLHYEMRIHGKLINPLRMKIPAEKPLPAVKMAEFIKVRDAMSTQLVSINTSTVIAMEGRRVQDKEM